MAMYDAKAKGKNTYQYYREHMNVAAVRRLSLETALRRALEREEFEVYFQPELELASGRIVAVEALNPVAASGRWPGVARSVHHGGRGVRADRADRPWVLTAACRQAAAWRDAGLAGLTVAVNVSGVQFLRQELPDLVQEALREARLAPTALRSR